MRGAHAVPLKGALVCATGFFSSASLSACKGSHSIPPEQSGPLPSPHPAVTLTAGCVSMLNTATLLFEYTGAAGA